MNAPEPEPITLEVLEEARHSFEEIRAAVDLLDKAMIGLQSDAIGKSASIDVTNAAWLLRRAHEKVLVLLEGIVKQEAEKALR